MQWIRYYGTLVLKVDKICSLGANSSTPELMGVKFGMESISFCGDCYHFWHLIALMSFF